MFVLTSPSHSTSDIQGGNSSPHSARKVVGVMYRAIGSGGRYFTSYQCGIIMPRAPTQVDTDDLDDATKDAWGQDVEEAQVEHYTA